MNFYFHKKAAILLLAALVLISLYSLKNLNISCRVQNTNEIYSVEFEYFGVDAEHIEKIIAEPLEEKIRAIENLVELTSTCEYSKCLATAIFKKNAAKNIYTELSDAADSVYRTLPKDAQHPRIYSSSAEQKAVFLAAFEESFPELESAVKPKLQAIPGVGEVLILGNERKEIHAQFDGQKLSQANILPWDIAHNLQLQNERGTTSIIQNDEKNQKIFFDSQINSLDKIKSIELQNAALYTLADIEFANQRQDKIVRINSKECVLLSIKTSTPEKTIKITRQAKKILNENIAKNIPLTIIYDTGKEQSAMILKIFAALLQSLIASIIIVFLIFGSVKITAMLSGFICLNLLFTLGVVSVLKIPLDISTISGITISIGLVCDAPLFICDIFCAAKNRNEFYRKLKKSYAALFISTLTTVCVIVPLLATEKIVGGIKNLAITSALMIGISAILAIVFLPVFIDSNCEKQAGNHLKLYDFIYNLCKKTAFLRTIRCKPAFFIAIFTILPTALFFFSAKNLSLKNGSKIIYSQIEYNPERSFKSADKNALAFIEKIQKIKGVEFVRSESRRGCVELEIVLDSPRKKEKIAKEVLSQKDCLSGYLYVPLSTPKALQSIQVAVLGNDNSTCRKIAKEAAAIAEKSFSKKQSQAVLNFKEDEKIVCARPIREYMAKNAIPLESLASFLRWNLFAPVADKILIGGKIYDIRAGERKTAFCDYASLDTIKGLSMPLGLDGQAVFLNGICDFTEEKMPSKIYRKNSRRAAYFTIEVQAKESSKTFRQLKKLLSSLSLPQGYSFSYPREFEQMGENYAKVFAAFVFAVLGIFILIAAQTEKIMDSLKALFTIPLSLVVPLGLRAIFRQPLHLGDAVAMVFLSGLCVNNALYILNEARTKNCSAECAAKSLFKSIESSSLTTICGALPVMFFAQDEFSAALSFFMLWGTIGALISGAIVFPNLVSRFSE